MIIPVLSWLSNASDGSYISVRDITGTYNVSTNPGGYGTPNEGTPDVIGFRARYWPTDDIYGSFVTDDAPTIAALLGSGGYPLTPALFGSTADEFAAGVHHFKYYPLEVYDTKVTLTNGSKLVTITAGTGADSWDTGYLGIVFGAINGLNKVYVIDRAETLSSTTFYLTEEWEGEDLTVQDVMLAPEADLKVLQLESANACLVERIGALAESCGCNNHEEEVLMQGVMLLRAAQADFDCDDFRGAHNKTLAVYTKWY